MTRKEAREWLLDHIPSKTIMPEAYSAYQTAIFALRPVSREQVRGKWKISDYGYFCSRCGTKLEDYYIKRFKFCPFCGAPMTDEAVEKLEALYEVAE